MLQRLSIQNFVLIDAITISFGEGLNVITGETGSGKSVILAALSFVLGDKTSGGIIRQGASSTSCEAIFDIKKLPETLPPLLEEANISIGNDEELILKRTLFQNGKNRMSICNQSVTLSFIKKIAPYLLEFSGQHAHLQLLIEDAPLHILDTFIGLKEAKSTFTRTLQVMRKVQREIETIENSQQARLRAIDVCILEVDEITSAKLREGEEEELFQEFQILSHQEELKQKTGELLFGLEEGKMAVLPQLIRQKATYERLLQMDPSLQKFSTSFTSSITELQEIAYEFKRYAAKQECSPGRLVSIEERLKELNHLKRKYGTTIEQMTAYAKSQEKNRIALEQQDTLLEELKMRYHTLHIEVTALALELTQARQQAALLLEKRITQEITSLNMPQARFEVIVSRCARCEWGDDNIEFFLTPNLGEKRIPLCEASGGELARIALALKMVLIDKEQMPTIVFDEIDANIGGKTASLIGEKLATLGASMQVISITHFPQVALSANSHFLIRKFEQEGRTHSTLEQLADETARAREIKRMLGGKELLYFDK